MCLPLERQPQWPEPAGWIHGGTLSMPSGRGCVYFPPEKPIEIWNSLKTEISGHIAALRKGREASWGTRATSRGDLRLFVTRQSGAARQETVPGALCCVIIAPRPSSSIQLQRLLDSAVSIPRSRPLAAGRTVQEPRAPASHICKV